MSKPLDEEYFSWLCTFVTSIKVKDPSRTYWSLLKKLFTKEFVWLVPNDDNRVEDGRDLRYEFVEEVGLPWDPDPAWLGLGCSMLEMLIGLSRRGSFEDDREPRTWFWEMVRNIGLIEFNDEYFLEDRTVDKLVDDILDDLVWRRYDYNGEGGLFPLLYPDKDQRDVELWYQMSSYILERT